MAKYKKTSSITMKNSDYPAAVEAANEIAKAKDRNVHEVVQDVLIAESERVKADNQSARAG